MGYGDYQLGNVIISRVYYVEGLGHNLFSVGQFCDSDLDVAFRKHTCYVQNLKGADLISESKDIKLYTISLDDMLKSSPICLVRGLPKLKFKKDHLCSACSLGKSKKYSHKPKADDTNEEKLNILHTDLCGPMHVESINGKKYILVIVDDYLRFTWFKFLRSKDETREVIIKCLKQIQFRLNATVKNVRTNNRTEFVNQTLKDYYENVEITHQTSVVHTSQLNSISSSRLVPRLMTPRILNSGLVPNPRSSTPYVPPTNNDWDILFQPMFDEFFNPPPSVVSSVSAVVARRPTDPTGSPVSTYIKQYAPSTSNSSNQEQEQSPVISKSVEEHIQSTQFDNTSFQDTPSEESYSNV
ncbi:retrovirus-related pol polyprotein from transposon TNT 1-94 [Tanacetum coccineum]